MKLIDDAKMYARFAVGLPKFLKLRITPEEARAVIRENMARREANFLQVLQKGVFEHPRSPYRALLDWAGCEFGDIERLCRKEGLTETLRKLRTAGVYVSFDEFKGRQPIERGGRTLAVRAHDFDNPFTRSSYAGESGGTTGSGTRVGHDLEHMAARMPIRILSEQFHGTANIPQAIWRGILPNAVGVNNMICSGVLGNVPRKWFSPLMSGDRKPSLKYRLANEYIIRMCRLYGIPVPSPEPVPLDRADIVVRWMEETLKAEGSCQVRGGVSLSLRIAVAAKELGVDLTGAVLSGGGEPPTEAKVKTITSTGARCLPSYHFSEAGAVGLACTHPIDCNDHHLIADHLEVFQYPRQVPGSDVMVDAFTLTTLLPTAPKLLLNVEIDDYGVIEERSCGCPWEALGFTKHVREIRSYRKLTGEGMTLVGSEMERILDEVLPATFGGTAQDYQLYEEEDEQGFTKRSLIVSPAVAIDDEAAVIRKVLETLGRGSDSADGARALWTQSQSLRIKRMQPIWTNRGKLMPLHLANRSNAPARRKEAQD